MKTWTNPMVEELEVKMTARGFTNEGKEWDFWHPADGKNPWADDEDKDTEGEYTPS